MDIRLDGVRLVRAGFALSADLAIPDGAAVAVIGPSGGGKSTLLDLIAGFAAPDAGRVLIAGRDVTHDRPAARPVTMLFQDHNLFPHLTLAQNVALGASPRARPDRAARARADEALAEVGLAREGDRRPAEVSGGQQSRAALARALLMDRPVLLLDEPFAALGPGLRAEMLALVLRLRRTRGLTLLMVTHDPDEARRMDGLGVFVADGRVHAPAPVADLLDAPPPEVAAYLG